jgi:hypothetical protein
MAKRLIKLLGEPIQNEDSKAAAVLTPGQLVAFDGSGDLIKHATAAGLAQPAFALEREEMGQGIDNTYAIGDTVKVGVFAPGDRVLVFIASGQNLIVGDALESAGDGTLKKGTTNPIARSLEVTGAVTVLTRLRAEIM